MLLGAHQNGQLPAVKTRRIGAALIFGYFTQRLGLSPQQLQKYECGASRVDAARLYQIAKELQVSVSYFFPGSGLAPSWMQTDAGADELYPLRADAARDAVEVSRALAQIEDPKLRKRVLTLVRLLAGKRRGTAS